VWRAGHQTTSSAVSDEGGDGQGSRVRTIRSLAGDGGGGLAPSNTTNRFPLSFQTTILGKFNSRLHAEQYLYSSLSTPTALNSAAN
jgi:hypothetical protein